MNTKTLLNATLLFFIINLASCSFVPAGGPQQGFGGPQGFQQGPGQVEYQNQGYLMEWHDTTGGGDRIDHSKSHHSGNAASPDGQEVRITKETLDVSDEELGAILQRLKNRRQ